MSLDQIAEIKFPQGQFLTGRFYGGLLAKDWWEKRPCWEKMTLERCTYWANKLIYERYGLSGERFIGERFIVERGLMETKDYWREG